MAERKSQSTYQYEPLVTPSKWNGEERRFSIRLSQLLDDLFRKQGAASQRLKKIEQKLDSSPEEPDAPSTPSFTLADVYPVGSVYMSVNSVSPDNLFGGTWERLKDTFLLAAGDTYEAGSNGGEAERKITIDELPSHSHIERVPVQGVGYKHWTGATAIEESETVYRIPAGNLGSLSASAVLSTESTGNSKAHNNMPPYIAVYMWKRTA